MGNTLYLAGLNSNILRRSTAVTPVPAASSIYPTSSLWDGNPGNVFRFTSNATNSYIVIDTNIVKNEGFEDTVSPFPPKWTDISSGSGAVAAATCNVIGGSGSAKLTAGTSGVAGIRQDVTVLSGESLDVGGSLFGGSTNHIKWSLQNLQTGHYLNAAGAWSTTLAFYIQQTSGTTWADTNLQTVSIESYANCGYTKEATIRLEVISTTATTGKGNPTYVDGIVMRHKIDFVSIHGHNLGSNISVQIQQDNQSSATTPTCTLATTGIRQPAFYTKMTCSSGRRWVRILFSGTNSKTIEIGELWAGQYKSLTDNPQYGYRLPISMPLEENKTAGDAAYRSARGYYPTENLELEFIALSTAVSSALRVVELEEMMNRCDWGSEPAVVVPYDVEPRVYLGILSPGLSATRPLKTQYMFDSITVQGLPFALRTS